MAFHVNQKVVCVRDDGYLVGYDLPYEGPAKGEIVTVSEIVPHPLGWPYGTFLKFHEWPRDTRTKQQAAFESIGYRPVASPGMQILLDIAANPPTETEPRKERESA